MSGRILAALIITIPILVLAALAGGLVGLVFVAIFGSILVLIVLSDDDDAGRRPPPR